MIKSIKFLLISLIIFLGLTLPVNANNIALTKKGSIEITLKEGTNNMIEGAEITIYHIADAIDLNNNLAYSLRNELSECNLVLDDLTNDNLINDISKCNIDNTNKYIGTTNKNGIVTFNNIELGLYYIKQTNNVSGYSNIDPFLITIPTIENNNWIYDIKAYPKTDIIRLMDLTVEKVWNHSSFIEIHPKEVTIELYKGEELIDTVILNKENNWTHTWKQIEKNDEYNVIEINVPNEYTATYRQEENKFIVTNTKTLVQTGMNLLLIEIIAGLGLIFIITGIVFQKRNKYE